MNARFSKNNNRQTGIQVVGWCKPGGGGGGGISSNVRYPGSACEKELDPFISKVLVKMRSQKDLKSMKKEVNCIENCGKIDTKCFKSVK